MNNNILNKRILKVKEFARKHHEDKSPHDWAHVLGVTAMARYLAEKEDEGVELLTVAALLHDIGYSLGPANVHNLNSAKAAKPFLKTLGYDDEFIEKVCTAIINHRRKFAKQTDDKLSHIMCDADKLDQLGIYGFLRVIYNKSNYKGKNLTEAVESALKKNKELYDVLFTRSARDLVKKECDEVEKIGQTFFERTKQHNLFK